MDLETLAVRYQVQGENEVRASLVNIGSATDTLAATVEEDTTRMSGAFAGLTAQMEKLSSRFERSGVMIAFAVEGLLDGQQTGVQRALRSIALLGFAFGGIPGIIATAGALGIEAIKNFVEKAEKEVKEFQKLMGDAINAGDVAKLMKAREDLITGTPFDPKTNEVVGESIYAIGNFKGSLEDLYATWQHLKKERADAENNIGGAGLFKDLDAQIKDMATQYSVKKKMLQELDRDLDLAETRRSRAAKQEQGPKVTISGESDKGKSEKALQALKARYEQEAELNKDHYNKLQVLDAAYLAIVIKQYHKGSTEYFEQLKVIEEHAREHLATLKTIGEEELRATLNRYKQQAETAKATYELQTKQAEDADTDTQTKYTRIEALDQKYLAFIVDIFDEGSVEYLDALREMEEHHKQHLDAMKNDEEEYAKNLKEINDMMEGWREAGAKKALEDSKKDAKLVTDAIEKTMTTAFAKGGNIGSAMKAFGDTIAAGLGQMLVQQGELYLEYGGIMQGLSALLGNPFTAGPAGIAIGLALIALGSALGALASGGGGSGGGGSSSRGAPPSPVSFTGSLGSTGTNSAANAGGITPVQPVSVTVIGPNDPSAQRQILQLISNGQRRNL